MLKDTLKDHTIILASASPRRQQYFKELELDFKIVLKPVKELFPNHLQEEEITNYLALLKAAPFKNELVENDILITSDTIVWHNNEQLGKPKDEAEAIAMLQKLSNSWHRVITSVCFTTTNTQKIVRHITKVKFKALHLDEIKHYVANYKPLDKAGAYGIQEWIGLIAIEEIQGSYPNVVGLPTHLVYKTLASI
ncbi:Maf family nucleotide pyrophosphatase [Cellulophaga sp. F20128]|uniref:Maf family nucleotide pyrophosphatase n=1 Tax=Cellulophaga sp. F20128 TaxID=2926413 RepID=UPI001FF27C9E|nr:Maf family nucleotide pyrophosphatase [Cellulophaga sp. F20128]MCK0157081.1 Maf family nucleotide pyrophosphatase [Cellulophaga sp. F20128]